MASSDTDICNLALGHLGEARITSLNEDSARAQACALQYDQTRDAVLRAHRWNFAQTRAVLTPLADAPAFGWAKHFQLPANCLRVLEVNGSEHGDVITDSYLLEGRKILTDATEVNLVYIQRVTDVSQLDALFVDLLALRLAIVLTETIRGTTNKTQELEAMYTNRAAPLARRVDANEGRRRRGLLPQNSYAVRARGAGSTYPFAEYPS